MAYKQTAGRSPMAKTGRGISPCMLKTDPEVKKAKIGEIPGEEEVRKRFEGKYVVTPKKNQPNKYSLTDKSGRSVSYSAGPKVKKEKRTLAQAINETIKK